MKTPYLSISGTSASKPFQVLGGNFARDYEAVEKFKVPRLFFHSNGEKIDNITDWPLNKFTAHYGKKAKITKDDIFAYVHAVLHDPNYRDTYTINLKHAFPRIPFYPNFAQWRAWGQHLLDLHIGCEPVKP